jgi:hypothetical protein
MTVESEPSDELQDAVLRLLELLGSQRVIQLTDLLENVCDHTGYGAVTITISDSRPDKIKETYSHE